MQKYKGSGLIIVKRMFTQQPPAVKGSFFASLGPEEKRVIESALATQWLPIEVVGSIFSKAAAALYPGNQRGLEELGRQQALDNLSGMYRPLMRVMTVSFAVQQVAKLWKSYFDEGKASGAQENGEKSAWLTVEEYPGLPSASRRVITGYVRGVVELCGAKGVQVSHDEGRPEKWAWSVTWI
jgi:hypothetical protein